MSAVVALILSGCQAATIPTGRTISAPPKMGQVLGVRAQQVSTPVVDAHGGKAAADQRIVRGRTIQISAVNGGHQILVDGRSLAMDTVDDRVIIKGVYEGGGRSYVLIEEQSGGIACPSLFQAIDLSGVAPVVLPQIGNCSDMPRISVSNGSLVVAVPIFGAAPAARFVFQDGHVRR